MADTIQPHLIRAEARPAIQWGELDQHQQKGLISIVKMLIETIEELKSDRTTASRYRERNASDKNRSGRIAFLSGGRGTGKTTLFLSLQQWTTSLPEEHDQEGNPLDLLHQLQRQGRMIWLEPLDMDILPEDVNLLAAILARIDDALTDREGQVANPHDGEWAYRPQGVLDAELGSNNPLIALLTV